MKKMIILLVFLIAVIVGFLYWAHLPANGHTSFVTNGAGASSSARSEIKILTYNIAYGRGREDDITVGPKSEALIKENLDKIAGLLKNTGADIVLLQEVDLASKRTRFIDEAKYLATSAGFPSYACVTTWIKNYIPFPYWPPSWHFGRMKSGQCILSKFPITENERIPLPQRADKPFFYTAFYLNRAIQAANVVIDGENCKIFNVHLEAFDARNRQNQIEILAGLVNNTAAGKIIVGGDFNALPPNATVKNNFPDEPEKEWKEWNDVRSDRSMEIFTSKVSKLREVFPADFPEDETFAFPSDEPNRRIDYIFFPGNMAVRQARVLKEAGTISDHLPVFVELKFF